MLNIKVFQEELKWIAHNPEMDIGAQADTAADAVERFAVAFRIEMEAGSIEDIIPMKPG